MGRMGTDLEGIHHKGTKDTEGEEEAELRGQGIPKWKFGNEERRSTDAHGLARTGRGCVICMLGSETFCF